MYLQYPYFVLDERINNELNLKYLNYAPLFGYDVEKYEDGDWEEVYNKELFYYDLVNDSWDSFKAYEDEYDSPEEEENAFEERYKDIVSNDIADWIIANTEDLF